MNKIMCLWFICLAGPLVPVFASTKIGDRDDKSHIKALAAHHCAKGHQRLYEASNYKDRYLARYNFEQVLSNERVKRDAPELWYQAWVGMGLAYATSSPDSKRKAKDCFLKAATPDARIANPDAYEQAHRGLTRLVWCDGLGSFMAHKTAAIKDCHKHDDIPQLMNLCTMLLESNAVYARNPIDWATLHNLMGGFYCRGHRVVAQDLRKALKHYNQAASGNIEQYAPEVWYRTQVGLGNTYVALGNMSKAHKHFALAATDKAQDTNPDAHEQAIKGLMRVAQIQNAQINQTHKRTIHEVDEMTTDQDAPPAKRARQIATMPS